MSVTAILAAPSPSSTDLWIGFGLGVAIVCTIGTAALIATSRPVPREGRRVHAAEVALLVLALAAAGWLRFAHVTTLNGGFLSQDEAQATRRYVSSVVSFSPVEFGATYITHAWLLDTWYRLFGIATHSARYFTAVLGLAGLGFFFATLRLLVDVRVAAWATAFLALATYSVYFSVIALETGSMMLAVPLVAFLFVMWWRRPTVLRSVMLGLAVGLGLFTYPAMVVGYTALVLAWATCWSVERLRRITAPDQVSHSVASVPATARAAAASFAFVFLAAKIMHSRLYAPSRGLLHGGGSFTASLSAFEAAMPVLLRDLFVETASWDLFLRHTPFVDWTYWPLVLLGAAVLWMRYPSWLVRGVLLSPVFAVLLAPLGGAYPGIRRALYILFPLCACAGVGVDELYHRAGRWTATALVFLALAHPVYYQATIGREYWQANLGASFGGPLLQESALLKALESHNVLLSREEFAHAWDRNRYHHFWKLALRHGVLRERRHTLTFVGGDDPASLAAAARQQDAAVLTWAPDSVVPAIAKSAGLCYALGGLEQRPALVPLLRPSEAKKGDVCLWRGGDESALTSCVRLGGRYRLSKAVHGVVCAEAWCDPSRAEFAFVQPGSVSFRLKPPAHRGPVVWLVLKIEKLPPWGRANRVYVNDRDLGVIDLTRLQADGRIRIPIPAAAQVEGAAWSVKLGPGGDPRQLGWDIAWAALEGEAPGGRAPGRRTPSDEDVCPRTLCVEQETGRICEE